MKTYTIDFTVWGYRMRTDIKAISMSVAMIRLVDVVCTYDQIVSVTRNIKPCYAD